MINEVETGNHNEISHGIALAELVACIEDLKVLPQSSSNFILLDFISLERKKSNPTVATRFEFLPNCLTLRAHKEGCKILLAFDEDVRPALCKACDDQAVCLAKAPKIVRK